MILIGPWLCPKERFMPFVGEIASLLTALCWCTNAILFTMAGRKVGSSTVNIVRLSMAMAAMLLLHLFMFGSPFPFHAGTTRLAWLGVSGLIGFALGDALLFEALVLLGPRLSMLIMTLWPVLAALMAWIFLGQVMSLWKALAILITLGGIALVVADKHTSSADEGKPRRFVFGLLLALGGALGQAVGFLFSKFGMTGGLSPISANVVRVSAGFLALGLWQLLRGELSPNFRKLKDVSTTWLLALGAISGPVIGVMLSLYAIDRSHSMGVASTLMSLSPVIMLPYSMFVDKERVGIVAILGTLLSIGGATALFLI